MHACIIGGGGGGGADHLWQRETIYGTMDGPRGTVHSSTDGPGGPSAVAMDGPGGPIIGGTIRCVTVQGLSPLLHVYSWISVVSSPGSTIGSYRMLAGWLLGGGHLESGNSLCPFCPGAVLRCGTICGTFLLHFVDVPPVSTG